RSSDQLLSTVTYPIVGVVKDICGNPLGYVDVIIYDSSGYYIGRTRTLLGGDFSVYLSAGSYKLKFEKTGYESKTLSISVSNSMNIGEIILDYALSLSISQVYLKVEESSDVSIPISIENKGSEKETMFFSVSVPDGWSADLYSGSVGVSALILDPGNAQSLTLKIYVPYGVRGLYNVTVKASGSTIQSVNVTLLVEKSDAQILTAMYPITQATPGSEVVFDFTVRNILTHGFTGILSLKLPSGWSGNIVKSDGSILYGVSLEPGASVNARLKLSIPLNEAPEKYETVLFLKTQTFEAELPFSIIITKGMPRIKLWTDTPYVDAYAGSVATFSIQVENIGDSNGMVDISVLDLPEGYSWAIRDLSGNALSKLYLKAGESKGLNVVVNIPPLAEPDVKLVRVQANAENSSDQLNLELGILGKYGLSYVTQSFYCETTAGDLAVFTLEVKNTGYSPLSNLAIEVTDIPNGFSINIDPNIVLLLKPQESSTFSITITTDADLSAGDYYLTLNLKADQVQASTRSLHVYVKQRGEVMLIGIIILVIMASALLLLYRRYGRR
ncbi:MAG: NEW3 domain-containing protein, partial [Thermoproteota archaeon]